MYIWYTKHHVVWANICGTYNAFILLYEAQLPYYQLSREDGRWFIPTPVPLVQHYYNCRQLYSTCFYRILKQLFFDSLDLQTHFGADSQTHFDADLQTHFGAILQLQYPACRSSRYLVDHIESSITWDDEQARLAAQKRQKPPPFCTGFVQRSD